MARTIADYPNDDVTVYLVEEDDLTTTSGQRTTC
jgi:hypothetical protein